MQRIFWFVFSACIEFVYPGCWHLDNDATSRIDDALTEHGSPGSKGFRCLRRHTFWCVFSFLSGRHRYMVFSQTLFDQIYMFLCSLESKFCDLFKAHLIFIFNLLPRAVESFKGNKPYDEVSVYTMSKVVKSCHKLS